MSKGDVLVDSGAWFVSRAGSIPGGNVRLFFIEYDFFLTMIIKITSLQALANVV